MSRNAVTAELEKLSHQLGVAPDGLKFLADVPTDDLRELRRQIGAALFHADRHHFTKVASLSRAIPPAVSAKISEFALPPLLAARTAELLEPRRAVDMVAQLSDGYLARVSAALDPGRVPGVIARIPAAKVAMVAAELARREQWVVIGSFVSYVSHASLRATIAGYTGEQLLRIGFVLDDTSRLGEIGALLSHQQLDEMLAAAGEQDLWRELDDLLGELDDPTAARLAARFDALPGSVRAGAAAAVERGDLSGASHARLALAPA